MLKSQWVKLALTIIISISIVWYFLSDIDWNEFFRAIQEADMILFIAVTVIMDLTFWVIPVIFNVWSLKWWHNYQLNFKEFFWVKGGLNLPGIINGTLMVAAVVLYVQKKSKITWSKFSGIIVYRIMIGLMVPNAGLLIVLIMSDTATIFQNSPIPTFVFWMIGISSFYGLIDLFLYVNFRIGVVRLFMSKKHGEFWSCLEQTTNKQLILMIGLTVVSAIIGMVGLWLSAIAFNVHIPWEMFFATIIFVALLSMLPVGFSGFGTTTAAWIAFYSAYGTSESLTSLTLMMPTMGLLIKVIIATIAFIPAMNIIKNLFAELRGDKETEDKAY